MAIDRFTFGLNWFRIFLIGLLIKRSAETPADCEEIDLSGTPKPSVSVTFHESLFFTILANHKNWNISTVIADVNGMECSLGLGFQDGRRLERLQCPGKKHEENVPNNINTHMSTHVSLDVDRRRTCTYHNDIFTYCSRRIRITLPQMLSSETYRPKWFSTSLEAPMTMTVKNISNAKLTINCKDIECLQTAGRLEGNDSYKRNAFFLKPSDSFQGLRIYLGDKEISYFSINNTILSVYGDSWFNITLEMEASDVKVFVDGRDVHKIRDNIDEIVIRSVEMDGKGLLTWCDPRDRKEVPGTFNALNLIVSIVLLGIIIVMAVVIIYLATKKEKSFPASQSTVATYANQWDIQEHDTYANTINGPHPNRIIRQDYENNAYGRVILTY